MRIERTVLLHDIDYTPTLDWPAGRPRTLPLSRRPSEAGHGSCTYGLRRIKRGLERLGGASVRISSNLSLDPNGAEVASASELVDPGVCVRFRIEDAAFAIACDRCETVNDNILLLARHVDSTAALVRHGVLTPAEALAAFSLSDRVKGARSRWRDVLGDAKSEDEVAHAFRRLSRERHPDTSSGSHDAMAELCKARDEALLELHSPLEPAADGLYETFVFESERAFGAMQAAERFVTEQGFSCGVSERGAPRGLRHGVHHIRRWSDLNSSERLALDGLMSGDMRNGPVTVQITSSALGAANAATPTAAEKAKGHRWPRRDQVRP